MYLETQSLREIGKLNKDNKKKGREGKEVCCKQIAKVRDVGTYNGNRVTRRYRSRGLTYKARDSIYKNIDRKEDLDMQANNLKEEVYKLFKGKS